MNCYDTAVLASVWRHLKQGRFGPVIDIVAGENGFETGVGRERRIRSHFKFCLARNSNLVSAMRNQVYAIRFRVCNISELSGLSLFLYLEKPFMKTKKEKRKETQLVATHVCVTNYYSCLNLQAMNARTTLAVVLRASASPHE